MILRVAVALVVFIAVAIGQDAPPLAEPQLPQKPRANSAVISTDDVLRMLKAGLAPDVVAARVKASRCECDTSPARLARTSLSRDHVGELTNYFFPVRWRFSRCAFLAARRMALR